MSTVLRRRSVALVTLGCARNEVDSEELAGRLDADGWDLVDEPAGADVVLVNTCGFVAEAKKDSVDTLLQLADLEAGPRTGRPPAVVAVGCLAERYGVELADALPEARAVLGFDDYPEISRRLQDVLDGVDRPAHVPRDRRVLLPITPVLRPGTGPAPPGHGGHRRVEDAGVPSGAAGSVERTVPGGPASGPRPLRKRLDGGPVAPLKLASGCDRRCSFCAIPSFRGAFVSRPPADVLAEARWLAEAGARELVLVSENSTSYGKDLADLRLMESLLPALASVPGVERIRVSYLQPAEMRPGLIDILTGTPGVASYFDLSFQHASASVLRRMRRFGDAERFLELLAQIRARDPAAGIRSNVIVGFPGETESDVEELERFLTAARLDAVGVFGYSDEEGTPAASFDEKVSDEEIHRRVDRVGRLVEELTAQRAEERRGELVDVLIEQVNADGTAEGRAAHQAPEVDGTTTVRASRSGYVVGTLVRARVSDSVGVDLIADPPDRREGGTG